VTRTSILVDVDNAVAGTKGQEMPVLSDLLEGLRDRFGRDAAMLLVATQQVDDQASVALRKVADRLGADLTLVPRQRFGSSVDVVLAVRAMEVLPTVDRLVLASGDGDMVSVLEAANRAGVHSIVVSRAEHTAVALSLVADDLIDPADLRYVLEGLITPGDGDTAKRAVMSQFGRATREIVVIDPYIGSGTIRLLAWAAPDIRLVVVGTRIDEEAREEARLLRHSGRDIRLIHQATVHDRWFRVDDRWWHSGSSLKDLGRRYSRISNIDEPEEKAAHETMLEQILSSAAEVSL
jgi:hypothetical protein